MSLKAILESLDGVGDEVKKHYTQKNGKFVLDVESVDGFVLEDVRGLKTALSKERDAVREAKQLLERLGDVKPEDVPGMAEELAKLRKAKPGDLEAEAVKAHLKQLTDKHTAEIKTREDRIAKIMGQLDRTLRTEAATAAIAKVGGSVPLLLPTVERFLKVREAQDGRFVTEIVDTAGNARITMKQGSQDPMSLDEFLGELQKDKTYAPAFPASGQSGSGATPSQNRGSGDGFFISAADASDTQKYRFAKAQAEKAGQPLVIGE